jgi:hypothetical protein
MDYGLVRDCPNNLKEGDYFRTMTYFISRSGRYEQYYTLYRGCTARLVGYWANSSHSFVKNLSHQKEKALDEVAEIIGTKDVEVIFSETPQKEHKKFEAFKLKWKQGRKAFYATPDPAFWEEWKKNKIKIKSAGFWVSKSKTGFMVFYKPPKILQ